MRNSTAMVEQLIARHYNPRILKKQSEVDCYTKKIKILGTELHFVLSVVWEKDRCWQYAFHIVNLESKKVLRRFRDSASSINDMLKIACSVLSTWIEQSIEESPLRYIVTLKNKDSSYPNISVVLEYFNINNDQLNELKSLGQVSLSTDIKIKDSEFEQAFLFKN